MDSPEPRKIIDVIKMLEDLHDFGGFQKRPLRTMGFAVGGSFSTDEGYQMNTTPLTCTCMKVALSAPIRDPWCPIHGDFAQLPEE